jgi:tetratricopeptide (TPR) repeat protein/predicted Ser/Thr protein kinase
MDQIGRYKVLGEIGRGGFGVVYRAHDPVMRRNVAVKVLTAVSDPTLLARFRSEAGATGNLRHKNIITVYDYGECDGQPFLVMELLEGRTLQEVIRGGPPLSLFEKVSVLFQVAEGLRFAHEQGVVHRDVKPSNVMLLHDGCAKILDFGIARYLDSARSRHTTPGFILGTIEYMSPDQLQGVDADPLTDIFSFGVTAYELLSGHQPFRADTISRIMYLVATADPAPLCQLVPGCPQALQNITRAALAKDRSKRYQNVQEMLLDLAPLETALRRERAVDLAAEAGRLIETGDLDNGQSSLNRALELDPACEKGQELRREIQRRRERRELLRQAEALVGAGEERMAARRFDEAVEAFESALRMIPAEAGPVRADVERRLFAASQSRETARRFAALFAEALEAAGRGDLPAAHRLASEAAALDPSNTEAAALAQQLAAEIERRQAEEERQRQERLRRQETISSVTQAVRGHVNAKRYSEALLLVEGALGQYPGDEILRNVGAAVQEARRRYAEELQAERQQAIERQRQAEEQLRLLEAESGEARPEEKPTPAPAAPDRPSVGRTPPSARDPLVAPLPSPPPHTPDRTPARPAPPQIRLGRRAIILAAAGLLALVLVFLLWPRSEEVQQPQLAGLQDAIPEAISTHHWQQAEASIARFQQLAPADPRAAKWGKQVEAGRALDALHSSIQDAIRQKDWATAEAQIKDLLAKAPYDPQIPIWQAQVIAGRKAIPPVKRDSKRDGQIQAELARAEQLLQQGDYQAAMDMFYRVLAQDRGNARAGNGLGKARDAKMLEDSVFGRGH